MGTASSKLRNALQRGDEPGALRIFAESGAHTLDPNGSYGEQYGQNTPLHIAGKYAMAEMLQRLLRNGGDPSTRNSSGQTLLHVLCCGSPEKALLIQDKQRADIIERLFRLDYKLELDLADIDGNTPLHHSAASGLPTVTSLLVNRGAPVFAKDHAERTACDCAVENGHTNVAALLESIMVFSGMDSSSMSEARAELMVGEESVYRGLRPQQVVEAKDYLLVDMADMLRVPLFAAQALLRHSEWSRPALLDEWMRDRDALCRAAGLPDLKSDAREELAFSASSATGRNHTAAPVTTDPSGELECDICFGTLQRGEAPAMPCEHRFCADCWRTFLDGKIRDGTTQMLECPASDCNGRVPAEVVDHLMPRDIRQRYDDFDMKAFVESNPMMRFCTMAGCNRVIELQPTTGQGGAESAATAAAVDSEKTSGRMVDCGLGHFFCWDCSGKAHEPCPCDIWEQWQKTVNEMKPTVSVVVNTEAESAANRVWMLSNSKPCPKCQIRIERSEGCNHMKCSKCYYDFCWMCREPWNLHSSATGGYFHCNRFEVVNKFEDSVDKELSAAEASQKKFMQQKRFAHFFSRFTAHGECIEIVEPLLGTAGEKVEQLVRLVSQCNQAAGLDASFLGESLQQLLAARYVLRASYAFGYFLDDPDLEHNPKYTIFNSLQSQLEEATEKLSAMIARKSLQAPRSHIVEAAVALRHRRVEFVSSVQRGLLPDNIDTRELEPQKSRRRNRSERRRPFGRQIHHPPPSPGRLPFLLPGLGLLDDEVEEESGACQRQGCTNRCTSRYPNYCSRSCAVAARQDGDDDERRLDSLMRATLLLSQLEALRDSRLQEPQRPRAEQPAQPPPVQDYPFLRPLERSHAPTPQRSQPQVNEVIGGRSTQSSSPEQSDDDDAVLQRVLALSQQETSARSAVRVNIGDSDDDEELARAISLSLMEASTSSTRV